LPTTSCGGAAPGADDKPSKTLHRTQQDAKNLLARFSDDGALEACVSSLKKLVDDVSWDFALRHYFTELKGLIARSLVGPEVIGDSSQAAEAIRAQAWRDAAYILLEGLQEIKAHRQSMHSLFQTINDWLPTLTGDREVEQFFSNARALIRCMFFDDCGRSTIAEDNHLPLTKVLAPLLQDALKYIYLPMVQVQDENMSFVMQHVLLRRPDHVAATVDVNKTVEMLESTADEPSQGTIRIHAMNLHMHVTDVYMAYKRKAFPKLSDVVCFDAEIGGDGLTIEVLLQSSTQPERVFDVNRVTTIVSDFSLQNVHGVEHTHAVHTLFKPVLQVQARRNLEQAICAAIYEKLIELNSFLIEYKNKIVFA